ncbi:MAG: CsbD family protein, partial [Ramlibacter sp.]|nr:CsbD family protein [Ramlibacter sp.]
QVKGSVKDVAGKAQEKLGEATNSKEQQAKGAAHQVEGKVQKKAGDVEQAADKLTRKP